MLKLDTKTSTNILVTTFVCLSDTCNLCNKIKKSGRCVKAHGTYRQRILVVFNLRSGWEWFVSEVSQAARQELCGTVTVEQEKCHTSTVRPMLNSTFNNMS